MYATNARMVFLKYSGMWIFEPRQHDGTTVLNVIFFWATKA